MKVEQPTNMEDEFVKYNEALAIKKIGFNNIYYTGGEFFTLSSKKIALYIVCTVTKTGK
jgi:hypothetical protein